MHPFAPILADTDDAIKVVIGIIVFIIWGIGALANLAKKQKRPSPQSQMEMEQAMRAQIEEARRREAAQALGQMGGPGMRPPMPPPPLMHPPQQQPRPRGPAVPPMRTLPQGSPQPVRVPPPPTVPPPAVRRPGPITQPGRGQPQRQQAKKQQQQRRRAPQVPIPASQLEELPPGGRLAGQLVGETPGVRESEIGTGVTPASPARRQAQAGPMVRLTSKTLREQFILTEILQPPLALRDHPPGT